MSTVSIDEDVNETQHSIALVTIAKQVNDEMLIY